MGELLGITMYPLSGARGVDLAEATVLPAGIEGDRQYVGYSPDDFAIPPYNNLTTREYRPGVHSRVSQKQQPGFAQIDALYDDNGALILSHETAGTVMASGDTHQLVYVHEFGDRTPGLDVGDEAAVFLDLVTGASMSDTVKATRLARKTHTWMSATKGVEARRVRPLHIVSAASVAALQEMAAEQGVGSDFNADRFRPNLLVDGGEPFEENGWPEMGAILKIGALSIKVTDLVARCPVPGNDQLTGERRGDVPRLYPKLARAADGRTPAFGVYGVPLIPKYSRKPVIAVGDEVRLAA